MSSANINSDNVGDSVYVRTYKPSEPVDEDLSSSYLFKDNPDLLLKSLAESLYAFDLTMSRYTPTNNSLAQRRVNLEESQALRQNINIEGRIEALKEYYFKTLDSASIDPEICKGVKNYIEKFLDNANEGNLADTIRSINSLVENRIAAFQLQTTSLAESIIKIPTIEQASVTKPSITS